MRHTWSRPATFLLLLCLAENSPLTGPSGCYNAVGSNFPNNLSGYNSFADIRFQ